MDLLKDKTWSELVELADLVKKAKQAKQAETTKTDWTKVINTCPNDGHVGPVLPDFGVKMARGVERAQSWCANCRSKADYYNKPRKYRRPR